MNAVHDTTCVVCGTGLDPAEVEDRARWLGGEFCSDACSYADARATGWVTDTEHEANVAGGWAR
ncbi:hypothetical protein I3U56_14470 [Mycobacteroides abscessus subsp. abscessus]|uniref:hypothetical protein n=1 Tax=Mycobacteroides abscessus TaxID=36809 RepID=UPI0019D30725|nr:hypothetical protein [Mycobacteroides abscessus]MBN7491650.1 hypothetical protein [Mycobacteroides abscessus subsp. abscessus]